MRQGRASPTKGDALGFTSHEREQRDEQRHDGDDEPEGEAMVPH